MNTLIIFNYMKADVTYFGQPGQPSFKDAVVETQNPAELLSLGFNVDSAVLEAARATNVNGSGLKGIRSELGWARQAEGETRKTIVFLNHLITSLTNKTEVSLENEIYSSVFVIFDLLTRPVDLGAGEDSIDVLTDEEYELFIATPKLGELGNFLKSKLTPEELQELNGHLSRLYSNLPRFEKVMQQVGI